ncbi:hypothetical protein [Streptomyces sp. G45]|uniref:hypothetical protein n=1 Tax=Streptomyces sp. G45 TaxID=3406627 RepID=UPI003C169055
MAPRRTTTASRLLLLAALLFGLVTMHTLGHPREHGGGPEVAHGGSHATATAAHAPRHAPENGRADEPEHAPAGERKAATADQPAPPSPGTGMDPLSLCLAVLGAALTFALLRRATATASGALLLVRGPTGLLDALRPNPPPPRALLSRLSVLRI